MTVRVFHPAIAGQVETGKIGPANAGQTKNEHMKAPITYTVPALAVNRYMVIVKPPEALLERIKRLQKRLVDDFGLKGEKIQSGYLLLSRFGMYAAQEERLLRKLHYAAMECPPYRISIEGFFSLPDHSVGLKIANPAAVKQINHFIQEHFAGVKFPGERPYYNHFPAIGLANRLEPAEYKKIWGKMEHRHFSATFTADHFMVLRKPSHAHHWSIVNRFAFENLPIQSRQGVLFA